ncbi:MAG: hypothetical protein USCGTAYLOR_02450 [Chromatiales bacterium USCg_Taylor]|nr:MAG: hypothetical protein USCGTAYLOR_02450 [Chromatiales bacterium USCg_Taylor]
MLLASINAPIDRSGGSTADRLRQLLLDDFRQLALADPVNEARFRSMAENTVLISVDFDAIADSECRRKYQAIPTSWTLEQNQIDAVQTMGQALLANDSAFADLLRITAGRADPSLPSLETACAAL